MQMAITPISDSGQEQGTPIWQYNQGDRGGNEICIRVIQSGQPMDPHRFWDGVITSSQNRTRLRNEATALRNRQAFQRSQITELESTAFDSWAK
jgi:hypothetical protein